MRTLIEQQTAAYRALDPLLPAAVEPPTGDVLTVELPDGERVTGVLREVWNQEGTLPSLWATRQVWELHPVVGDTGARGMAALLAHWRGALSALRPAPSDSDSACLLHWPSRDAETSRVLLDHGLLPLSAIGVRTGATPPSSQGRSVTIRAATMADLDIAVGIELAELRYSAQVGGAVVREDAEPLKRRALRYRLDAGDPVWLAEADGVPLALAEFRVQEMPQAADTGYTVPAGRWGYVNCVSVLPTARGKGVGQALMAAVHRELARADVLGCYLYYNPTNPLSSVFWPRQGYRPLWTMWEVRPATALRMLASR